jgi:hypothetical protein
VTAPPGYDAAPPVGPGHACRRPRRHASRARRWPPVCPPPRAASSLRSARSGPLLHETLAACGPRAASGSASGAAPGGEGPRHHAATPKWQRTSRRHTSSVGPAGRSPSSSPPRLSRAFSPRSSLPTGDWGCCSLRYLPSGGPGLLYVPLFFTLEFDLNFILQISCRF